MTAMNLSASYVRNLQFHTHQQLEEGSKPWRQ